MLWFWLQAMRGFLERFPPWCHRRRKKSEAERAKHTFSRRFRSPGAIKQAENVPLTIRSVQPVRYIYGYGFAVWVIFPTIYDFTTENQLQKCVLFCGCTPNKAKN